MLRNPFVINIVTRALLNLEGNYVTDSPEWPNGMRSDVVLVHKEASTDHPPIIIEFQRAVGEDFVKKVLIHSNQSEKRHKTVPIILVVCIESIHNQVKGYLKKCDDLPCYSLAVPWWNSRFYIINNTSIQDHVMDRGLDPFVAFGLFFTSQATSVHVSLRSDDPTINMPHRISLEVYRDILREDTQPVDELKQLADIYHSQFEKIINLLKDKNTTKSVVLDYALQYYEYSKQQKRKYDELSVGNSLEEYQEMERIKYQKTESAGPSQQQEAQSEFEIRMAFVEKFMEGRNERGEPMNWEICLLEGRRELNWKYKSATSLRTAYIRFGKRKQ
ncbi:unnamed protein product [Rhizopus stolonifer]